MACHPKMRPQISRIAPRPRKATRSACPRASPRGLLAGSNSARRRAISRSSDARGCSSRVSSPRSRSSAAATARSCAARGRFEQAQRELERRRCDCTSCGLPALLPSGKSLKRNRGTRSARRCPSRNHHDGRMPFASNSARSSSRSGGRPGNWARGGRHPLRLPRSGEDLRAVTSSVRCWLRWVGAP